MNDVQPMQTTVDDLPAWLMGNRPAEVLKQIRDDPQLLAIANNGREGSLVDGLMQKIDDGQIYAFAKAMIAQMVSAAHDYEAKRLRRAMKDGREIHTDFPFILAREVAWNVHHDDGGSADTDATLALLTDAARGELVDYLTMWKLPDGRSLGDATAGDLRRFAQIERATAEGHLRNAVFYERVAGDLADAAVIRNHVTPQRVEAARIAAFMNEVRP